MRIPDLLFLVAMVATLATALLVLWQLVRGAGAAARRIGIRWAIGTAAYVAALLVASLVQPGRVVPLGADECFDDWCIAVTAAETRSTQTVVTLRVSNRGRGRPQAEPDAYVYLRDNAGHEIPASAARLGAAPSIGDQIPAGESRTVEAAFDAPNGAREFSLVKARRARFPGNVIIGDPNSFLHRPTVHSLTSARRERR